MLSALESLQLTILLIISGVARLTPIVDHRRYYTKVGTRECCVQINTLLFYIDINISLQNKD